MRGDVARDMAWSAGLFLDLVWPAVRRLAGGGAVIPVENADTKRADSPDPARAALDQYAGIDAWQVFSGDSRVRGIASRIQELQPNQPLYETFTLRYRRPTGTETEFSKRLAAIRASEEQGWILPHLTIHAYIRGDRLLAASMAKTRDLYDAADKLFEPPRGRRGTAWIMSNGADGVEFLCVSWAALRARGVKVIVVRPDGVTSPTGASGLAGGPPLILEG